MLSQLKAIESGICARTWSDTSNELWGGAGVVIKEQPVEGSDDLVLVTAFAREASALMMQIQDACSDWIDFANKHRFYGKVAEAAVTYTKTASDKWGLLETMIREAIRLEQTERRKLYFAYGSNMDEQQMDSRCPNAILIRTVTIPGYAFAIDSAGVATIVKSDNDSVEGLLWSICIIDETALDRYEGVAAGCYRREYIAVPQSDDDSKMLVYISNREKNKGGRRSGYLEKIIAAAEMHGFSSSYVAAIRALNV